jgi:hypothetical protein
MRRPLILIVCAALISSCGGKSGEPADGTIDSRSNTSASSPDVSSKPAARARPCRPGMPPEPPSIVARRNGYRITVDYRFASEACLPSKLLITVRSKEKQDNVGFRDGGGAAIPVHDAGGSLTFYAPFLELPPYMANASSYTPGGERSRVVSTVAPESRPYCLETRPLADCLRAARAHYTRCAQGRGPRAECHPKLWRTRPRRPTAPLRGFTAKALERSVREQVGTTFWTQVGGRALDIRCPTTAVCFVTYGRVGDRRSRFTARYAISAQSGVPSCWFVARTKVVRRPVDPRVLDAVGAQDGPSDSPNGCVRE